MNYREAHRILDRSYIGIRRARLWMCWLLGSVGLVVCIIGALDKQPAAAFAAPIVCLLLAFIWWAWCSAYMVIMAGLHAMITTARAQVGDVVEDETNCAAVHAKLLASLRQPAPPAAPPATAASGIKPATKLQPRSERQPTPTKPPDPPDLRPGESLDAWAKRVEQEEVASFQARTKA